GGKNGYRRRGKTNAGRTAAERGRSGETEEGPAESANGLTAVRRQCGGYPADIAANRSSLFLVLLLLRSFSATVIV
ncbi:hypothetical protein L195_g051583, partial [Trifolium pratense]